MRLRAEVPMHTNIVSPISRHHRRAPLPLTISSFHSTRSRVCLFRPTALALTRKLGLGRVVYSRLTSHRVQWSRDVCLGHDGVSSRLHSRPRGAAFRLSKPSVARGYHSGERNVHSIFDFLFWAVDAPKCNTGLEVVVRLLSLRKQPLCSHSPSFGVDSFRVKRHDILWLFSLSIRTRPIYTKACFVPPAIATLHGTILQNTGRTTKTHVGVGTILRSAARPGRTCRVNVGKPHEWDTSCTSSHVAVARQLQLAA